MSDPLAIYLHDHLSGARMATELLRSLRDTQKDKPLEKFVVRLLAEVEADRELLQGMSEKLGAGSNSFKEMTGWLAEKATHIKLGLGAEGDLGTLEALEFLALGILGKVSLWKTLEVAAAADGRLSGYDFQQLAASALTQHDKVEQQGLELAKTALRRTR